MYWKHGQPPLAVPTPRPATESWASAIGGDRTVVGSYVDKATGAPHCFAWRTDMGAIDLGMMGTGDGCLAHGLSISGLLTGSADPAPHAQAHAFLLADGVFTDLGVLGTDLWSQGWAVNSGGLVVGWSSSEQGDHAFSWQQGTMTELDRWGEYLWSHALAVNDKGIIVGFGSTYNDSWALRFDRHGPVRLEDEVDELDDWHLWFATGVTLDGRIVGAGHRSDGNHGFMLVPLAPG